MGAPCPKPLRLNSTILHFARVFAVQCNFAPTEIRRIRHFRRCFSSAPSEQPSPPRL